MMWLRRGRFGGLLFLGSCRAQPHRLGKMPSIGGLTSSVTSPQAVAPVEGFGMPKRIPLTQGKFAIVDEIDFASLSKHKWYYHKGYAVRKIKQDGKQRTIYMHRVILKPPVGLESDHLNGNGCDNRRCNLRSCTHSQNLRNSRKPAHRRGNTCSSKYKGVTWHKQAGKWQAQIGGSSDKPYLGMFDHEKEAAVEYNAEAAKLFGAFANLNDV